MSGEAIYGGRNEDRIVGYTADANTPGAKAEPQYGGRNEDRIVGYTYTVDPATHWENTYTAGEKSFTPGFAAALKAGTIVRAGNGVYRGFPANGGDPDKYPLYDASGNHIGQHSVDSNGLGQWLPSLLALAGNFIVPGLGFGLSGATGAALGSGLGTALTGGKLEDVLKSGLLTYGGAQLGSAVKGLTGDVMQNVSTGNPLVDKVASSAVGGGLTGAGKAALTGKDIGTGFVSGLGSGALGGATSLVDNAVTSAANDAVGEGRIAGALGDGAGALFRGALTGQDAGKTLTNLATNTVLGAGADAIKSTDAYKDVVGNLSTDGINTDNLVSGLDSKTAMQLANAVPALKPLTSAVGAVKNVASGNDVLGGIDTLTNLGKTTVKRPPAAVMAAVMAAAKKPPTAVIAATKPAVPAAKAQPPAAVLAAFNQKKPVG